MDLTAPVPASRISLACPDWAERLRDGRSLVPTLPLHGPSGDRAVAVFDKLRLADVPGTPRLGPALPSDPPDQPGDAAGDWFRDIVRALFGAMDPVTKARFIREIFCLVPKKNSKTSYGALLMLTALLLNERPAARFGLTAPVQDTADLAFSQAMGAIELDAVLKAKLQTREHLKTIVHRDTGAKLEIMTFDPAILTGQKFVGLLIDEMHVVAKMAKAASALRQLRGGMLPFPEAFMVTITTQSEEAPVGIMKAELDKARSVRDGRLNARILPVLYEFPTAMQVHKDKPWRDPANWHMVTPNAGKSITVDRLVEECELAEISGEAELRGWASQHLNIQIGLALMADGWAGSNYWEQQGDETLTLDSILERCEVVTIGIDGGGLDDLLGFGVLGRITGTQRWLHWGKAWAHKDVLTLRKSEASRLEDYVRDGDLVLVSKMTEAFTQVADLVVKIEKSGLLDRIGVDPVGIASIVDEIEARKIESDRIIGIPQGWKLSGAIKTTEVKLADGELEHCAQPILAWSVGNAKAEARGNATIITKQAAGTGKIDPLIALLNAAALMSMNPKPRKKKYQLLFT
jgi:phage terminase large subunit-like protein